VSIVRQCSSNFVLTHHPNLAVRMSRAKVTRVHKPQNCPKLLRVFAFLLCFRCTVWGLRHRWHYANTLGRYISESDESIFELLTFTRWRGPLQYMSSLKAGESVEDLTYGSVEKQHLKVSRAEALRLSLQRKDEVDYAHRFPRIYDRFDISVHWDVRASRGWDDLELWASGRVCSCYIEAITGDRSVKERKIRELEGLVSGIHRSTTKTCFRILLVGGGDTHLSEPIIFKLITRIQDSAYFDRIYYEAYDVDSPSLPSVWPMPIGLTDFYVLAIPPGKIEAALLDLNLSKKKGAIAAWGSFWPDLDNQLPWRKSLAKFVQNTRWLQRSYVKQSDWYSELASYRFMFCPDGAGVVSPKWMEALLVQTIPIAPKLPAYVKLQEMGYPFVVVDRWEDVTPHKLRIWWRQLSPLLEKFSWSHTSNCWWALLTTPGAVPSVERALEHCIPPYYASILHKSRIK